MDTRNIKCNRCGEILEVVEEIDYDDECYGKSITLRCSNCGAQFECLEPSDEEKDKFDFYNDGEPIDGRLEDTDIMNGHCINCGHEIFVSNNFMLSDYDDSIKDENDDKMNFVMNQCQYCGMVETRWDTAENEKPGLPYWKDDIESN